MTLAWYDPTTNRVSTDKNDPLFTPLGQLWPLGRIDEAVEDNLNKMPTKLVGPNLVEILNAAGFYKKKEWVGLSGKEINHIFAANVGYPERMMKEVENLLKEKNT